MIISNLLPKSSADARQIFDERYNAEQLITQPQTWVGELGEVHPTEVPHTRYPMSILSLKYVEANGGETYFQRIGEKDVELKVSEFEAGVEEKLVNLMTNAFSAKRWNDAPANMLQAEEMFKLKKIAKALEDNEACGWDGLAIFHDAHKCNFNESDSLTFDNLQASAKDVANLTSLEEEITLMAEVLDQNGDPLGVMPTHIGVPRQKFQKLKNLLKQDFTPNSAGTATMRNPYNDGSLTVVRMDQLTDPNDWYLFDANLIARNVHPWVLAKLQISNPEFNALGQRWYTTDNSDHARKNGTIGVSSHLFYGHRLLYPHAIRKIAGV
jgi:hypothetical protein